MTFSLESLQGIVFDGHYSLKYQQGEPSFDVENINISDPDQKIYLQRLNQSFLAPSTPPANGLHLSINHSHHLDLNLDLDECKSLEKLVLWDIEFYKALLLKVSLINSFAIKILSLHIAEDQMLLKDIEKRVSELKLHRPS